MPKKKKYRGMALALSMALLMLWGALGTGASLAWFADADEVTNIFHMANFDLQVKYKDGSEWKSVEYDTKLFDEEALYEPGYTQVVYLEVKNAGERDFKFHTAVTVSNPGFAINVFGQQFALQDYLRFGVVVASTEATLLDEVDTRAEAVTHAVTKLGNYDQLGVTELTAGKTAYVALVLTMPESVGNEANYRGTQPHVDLGITISATQIEEP